MRKIGVVVLLCSMILSGCSTKEGEEIISEETKPEIGLSFDSFVIERWHREQEVFMERAEELGTTVYVQNANGDVKKQIDQIEHLIEEGVDAIVIIPTDADAVAPVISKAKEEGIKVIAYDRLVHNADVDLYISFDNEQIGRSMTRGLLEGIHRKGDILAIMGSPTDHNVEIIDAEFEKWTKMLDGKVLEKVYADNWNAEVAFNTVSKHLKANKEIAGIFCGNDDLAQQAIKALSEYRKAGKVCVVGQDADLLACQRIVEETQDMTIYKNVLALAKEAANMTVKLVKDEALDIEESIFDGTYYVPYYKIATTAVTKENMDEIPHQ